MNNRNYNNNNNNNKRYGGNGGRGGGSAINRPKVELPSDVAELFASVRDNNIDNVKRLIAQGVEINMKDDKLRAPIHLAAWHGHRDMLMVLLRQKADIQSKAMDGFTAVHFAALGGHGDCIRAIAEKNKSILNAKSSKGDKTALHIAVSKCHEDAIRALIEAGCDQTSKMTSGQTAFDLADSKMKDVITDATAQRALLKNKDKGGIGELDLAESYACKADDGVRGPYLGIVSEPDSHVNGALEKGKRKIDELDNDLDNNNSSSSSSNSISNSYINSNSNSYSNSNSNSNSNNNSSNRPSKSARSEDLPEVNTD